jgi:hypothetical protein
LQDLPALLERQPNLEVFCEGVLFEDRLSPRLGLPAASCSGREAYSRLMWSLRFHKTLFFAATRVGAACLPACLPAGRGSLLLSPWLLLRCRCLLTWLPLQMHVPESHACMAI